MHFLGVAGMPRRIPGEQFVLPLLVTIIANVLQKPSILV